MSLLHEMGLLHMHRTPGCRPFRFIQVGALELAGHHNIVEVARQFGEYRGVLIDAQPVAIERLLAKYRDDNSLTVLQRAVTDIPGEVVFFSVNNADKRFPGWVEGLASLDRTNLLKFEKQLPGVASRIVETRVQAVTLADVAKKYLPGEIDLLMIDAEGHDYRILQTFSFINVTPAVVFLEHSNLSAQDRERAVGLLVSHGYQVACLESDLLASHRGRLPS